MTTDKKEHRSGLRVMMGLIGMIKPLLPVMLLAILMGCIGNLMATFITVLGGYGFLFVAGMWEGRLSAIFAWMVVCALLRGVLRYAEQASNHYIAFKLLARIRHRVFSALRRLAPAKLDGSRKGNLISIITSDIELLEVFYAHTISPIAIAVITSIFMIVFIGMLHPVAGVIAACFYLLVGLVIPLANGRRGSSKGQEYRDSFGELNTCVLDNLYGLEEIIQYGQQDERMEQMKNQTKHLESVNAQLKDWENGQRVATDAVIAVIAMMSSFGPTAALASLSNNLHHTLASGNRVLDILAEEPVVDDVTDGSEICEREIRCENVYYAYNDQRNAKMVSGDREAYADPERQENLEQKEVLNDFSATFSKNRIHGIFGKSGCGKSTLLKLLMRFYETNQGNISYGKENVNHINTNALRKNISYVTEGIILKSLVQEKENKTIILVSHRKSTMGIADDVLAM